MNMSEETVSFPTIHYAKVPVLGFSVMGSVLGIILFLKFAQVDIPSKVIGGLLWLPLIACLLENSWHSFANNRRVHRWAQNFQYCIDIHELCEMVEREPHRFVLLVHQVGKTNWWEQSTILAVLSDEGGQKWAIMPPREEVVVVCEKAGVKIKKV